MEMLYLCGGKDKRMKIVTKIIGLMMVCASPMTGWAQTYGSDIRLSMRNFVDTVRIEYDHGLVFVPVTIGGDRMRFLLDTGAGRAVVYDDRLIAGCTEAGTIVSHDAIGHIDTVKVLELPPITIGKLTVSGCKATLQHRAVRRQNIDGIIGFDIVNKGLSMKIDTRDSLLILTDQRRFFRQEQGYSARYSLQRNVPFVKVSPFEGYSERVLFDTGSRQLYSMNKQHFDRAEKACLQQNAAQIEGRSMGRHAIGFSGAEPLGEVVFLGMDRLKWGRFEFRDIHTLTTQGGSHIGARILSYGSLIIEARKKRMLFQPYDTMEWVNISNRQTEKAIIQENGLPVVGLVWERSEAWQAGLRQGDTILKADGQPIRSFAEYVAFRPLRGRIYTVTVRDRRGFLKEINMRW